MPLPIWPAPVHATATLITDVPPAFVWRAFESAPRWPEVLKDIERAAIEPDGRLVAIGKYTETSGGALKVEKVLIDQDV